MTRLERRVGLAALGAAAAVVYSGVRLARKRARYLAELAASRFPAEKEADDQDFGDDLSEDKSDMLDILQDP